jgi:uncharacterized protein
VSGSKKTNATSAEVVPLRPSRKCPICGKDAARATYPFCSKRCAEIDLSRWLSGSYAIPAVEDDASVQSDETVDGEG